jgi:cytochrome c biogenesis factor
MWCLCLYFYDSNCSSSSGSSSLCKEETHRSHHHPFERNLQHCFIPTFAMHCSLVFVCKLEFVLGFRKVRVLRKKIVSSPFYEVFLFILLKPLLFPFPLRPLLCLFRRVEIGFVCASSSSFLLQLSVTLRLCILCCYLWRWFSNLMAFADKVFVLENILHLCWNIYWERAQLFESLFVFCPAVPCPSSQQPERSNVTSVSVDSSDIIIPQYPNTV